MATPIRAPALEPGAAEESPPAARPPPHAVRLRARAVVAAKPARTRRLLITEDPFGWSCSATRRQRRAERASAYGPDGRSRTGEGGYGGRRTVTGAGLGREQRTQARRPVNQLTAVRLRRRQGSSPCDRSH